MAAPKVRNSGSWTEGRFTSFVTSALRRAFSRWPPKYETLKESFVGIKENKATKRQAKHYLCATCGGEFPSTNVQVDHIIPIGFGRTWDEFINSLFCESNNLQVLCKPCHAAKTKQERQQALENSKNNRN